MIIHHTDERYKFKSVFNTVNGFYKRTGILDNDGVDTGVDPFMASFPELIDIGIMGHCKHGLSGKCKASGVQCYQHGDIQRAKHMTLEDYKSIIDECSGKTFQVALGGCGDPDQHPDFKEILKYTRDKNIVPNYTTSGFGLTDDAVRLTKLYCGAVAVSWYRSKYTIMALDKFIKAGVITNIHYVLGNNTIDEAIDLLENGGFPSGINAVIFLLHKPIGLGDAENVLKLGDKRIDKFFSLVDKFNFEYKVGFDSCTVPGILTHMKKFNTSSIETCEAARWSMYITPDMKALPCSFDNQSLRYAVDIRKAGSIESAWNSEKFNEIRKKFKSDRCKCKYYKDCLGGCPLIEGIQLCKENEGLCEE